MQMKSLKVTDKGLLLANLLALLRGHEIDLNLSAQRFCGTSERRQRHGSIGWVQETIERGPRGVHLLCHRCFRHLLLLHQVSDFERESALECGGFDFLENSFLVEKIIEVASVVRVVNFFRLCCVHFFVSRPGPFPPVVFSVFS